MGSHGQPPEFPAPVSRTLRVTSVLASGILIGVPVIGWVALPGNASLSGRLILSVVPLLVLLGAIPFVVRGYRIEPGRLRIRRLGWSTCIPLDGLKSAEADPGLVRHSLRLAGNGGLFSFTGLYWNRRLGRFRAFVTDPSRAVVLRFRERTVVVSPDDPARFVAAVSGPDPGRQ